MRVQLAVSPYMMELKGVVIRPSWNCFATLYDVPPANVEVSGHKLYYFFGGAVVFIEQDSTLLGDITVMAMIVMEQSVEKGVIRSFVIVHGEELGSHLHVVSS